MSDGWIGLTVAHLAATWAMVGLMWTIHFVHYPSFSLVGEGHYRDFQAQHMRRISWVLALPWGVEGLTAVALVLAAPDAGLRSMAAAGLAVVVMLLAITAFGAAPIHGRLLDGFDESDHRRLLRVDALRTALWTGRGFLAAVIVLRTVT